MKEYNFDGLVGPTHSYTGLSYGNVASITNAGSAANPHQAAKQGLQKMRLLMELGIPQAVLPPHQRPNFNLLRDLGFSGQPMHMLQQAHKVNPALLAAVYSAASMWTANMATVSPSSNTQDGRLHITPANLTYNLHRAQEAEFSYNLLRKIFHDTTQFVVHHPLPSFRDLGDEGAANHSTLCHEYGTQGLELFVYGRHGLDATNTTSKYPARQTQLASQAIAQNHQLHVDRTIFLQQNPLAIDIGAFHNDVVCVANKNVILYHTQAFVNWQAAQSKIKQFFADDCYFIEVGADELSLAEAISTYLFNSQVVSLSADVMDLIAPSECQESQAAMRVIADILAGDNPIKEVEFVECRQSMRNGGGPACLRLRVMLNKEQEAACMQSVFMSADLLGKLDAWVDKHYRDKLKAADFLDPQLYLEVESALDELTQILNLGSIYPFQHI